MLPCNIHVLAGGYEPHSLSRNEAKPACAKHTYLLWPANPCPSTVHMKPFSTSVFKVFIWIIATTTKICTRSCFTQVYTKGCVTNHHALLHTDMFETVVGYQSPAWAPSIFGASPFGRWVVTHSLADFDFHDHRPAVKMNQHPFWYLMSKQLSTLTQR